MNIAESLTICLYVLYYIFTYCFQYVSKKLGSHDHFLVNHHGLRVVWMLQLTAYYLCWFYPCASFFLLPVLYSFLPILSPLHTPLSPSLSVCSLFWYSTRQMELLYHWLSNQSISLVSRCFKELDPQLFGAAQLSLASARGGLVLTCGAGHFNCR